MPEPAIHRFELEGRKYAIDPETCFCFECDAISWDVLEHYPGASLTRIQHLLRDTHDPQVVAEVIGELEWLRASKSILPAPSPDKLKEQFTVERGVRRLTAALPPPASAGTSDELAARRRGWFRSGGQTQADHSAQPAHLRDAIALLLGRSERQAKLRLEFVAGGQRRNWDAMDELCADALRAARFAGKELTLALRVRDARMDKLPAALAGHTLDYRVAIGSGADLSGALAAAAGLPDTLPRLAKEFGNLPKDVSGTVTVRPGHADFSGAVEALEQLGFKWIELDLDGAYAAQPSLDPAAMFEGLRATAHFYAERLRANHYFRLDPIAGLFRRIYEGAPSPRTDPAGTHALAVDHDGGVYPSEHLFGIEALRLGSIQNGAFDETLLRRFDDLGAQTTAVCRRCWARNLCGGGSAAVHQALSGSFRQPHPDWCEAQRAWMTEAVSAFNKLSSAGVNFTRVYATLTPGARPSMFTALRAALKMSVLMRPLSEADAEQLVEWENWNDAAYFVCSEKGMLMATKYDREMDTLHPATMDQEMMITRRNGTPMGLIKIRPDLALGAAQVSIFLADESHYDAGDVRKAFGFLLEQLAGQESLNRMLVPTAPWESGLKRFLEHVGFQHVGVQREAVYLHGAYHDLDTYYLALK